MKQTKDTTETRPQAETPSERSEVSSNVVSLDDFRKRKQTSNSVKQEFRDSLDNDRVMQHYNIQQPTLEERTERIRQSIARINAMLREANDQ